MKILQVASGNFFSTLGGGQVYVKNIVDQFIEGGIDVSVLSFSSNASEVESGKYNSIPIYHVPDNFHVETLTELIKEISPQIIHAHSCKDVICKIGKILNIPVVVTSHHGGIFCPAGTLLNHKYQICNKHTSHADCLPCVLRNTRTGLKCWYPFMRHLSEAHYLKLGDYLQKHRFIPFITPIGSSACFIRDKKNVWDDIAENCSLMIAPCEAIGDAMVNNGLNRLKLKILPHGIPLPKEKPDYPAIYGDKLKFYYVGRISYVKGIDILLRAFHSINNKNIELHLIGGVVGKMETRYLNRLQREYKSDTRIIWHGKVEPDKVFEITKDFHVSVAPSVYLEVYGLNIAESLALGKPVIATRCGGGEMQIKDGYNGWIIEPNNYKALAKQIEYVINHKDILIEMSNNCQANSIQKHCRDLITIYQDVSSSFKC